MSQASSSTRRLRYMREARADEEGFDEQDRAGEREQPGRGGPRVAVAHQAAQPAQAVVARGQPRGQRRQADGDCTLGRRERRLQAERRAAMRAEDARDALAPGLAALPLELQHRLHEGAPGRQAPHREGAEQALPEDEAARRPQVGETGFFAEGRPGDDEQDRAIEPGLEPDDDEEGPAADERQRRGGGQQHEGVHRCAARPDRSGVGRNDPNAEIAGLEHAARPKIEANGCDLHARSPSRARPWNRKYATMPSQHAAPTPNLTSALIQRADDQKASRPAAIMNIAVMP